MGSALLLGPGMAAAQIELDGTAAAGNAPTAVRVAAESISTAEGNRLVQGTTVLGYNVNIGTNTIGVSARAAVPAGYFVRVKLDGAVFRADPTLTGGGTLAQGGAMMDQAVFAVPTGGIARRAADATTPSVSLDVGDTLAVTSASPGMVTASITAHRDQFDAIDGIGPLATRYFGGSAAFINKVSGITATVSAGRTAVADAAVGFRWFVNPAGDPANTASATLGSFTVAERTATAGDAATVDASTGAQLAAEALIPPANGVLLRVEGELGIGAFSLTRDDPATGSDTAPMVEVACPAVADGSADAPLMGNVKGTMDMPNVGTASTSTAGASPELFGRTAAAATGTFTLCVTVDTMGAMSNDAPLPITEFTGTILLPNTNTAIAPRELATGPIGRIARNGASANIAYLTTSEKHNQRLIIVNRGTRPVLLTDVTFQTEDGTEADLTDAAKAAAALPEEDRAIGAGESMTIRVSDMVSITGNSRRAAAVLSFNGTKDNISVATTQVNLEDSSTDTVMWPVN